MLLPFVGSLVQIVLKKKTLHDNKYDKNVLIIQENMKPLNLNSDTKRGSKCDSKLVRTAFE